MAGRIHIVLMSKGGVGKTTAAVLLTQFLRENGREVLAVDTDPATPVFSRYKGLDVKYIDIKTDTKIGKSVRKGIEASGHDELLRTISEAPEDAEIVVDVGASNFTQFVNWMLKMDVVDFVAGEFERELIIHTPLAGGPDLIGCMQGLSDLLPAISEPASFVIWLNPLHGGLAVKGTPFEDTALYKNNTARIAALVELPTYSDPKDREMMELVFSKNQTFAEFLKDPAEDFIARRRVKMTKEEIFEPIAAAGLA